MTSNSGWPLNFKCPYHANVMKTFEQVSSTMSSQRDSVSEFMPRKLNFPGDSVKSDLPAHGNGLSSRVMPKFMKVALKWLLGLFILASWGIAFF